MRMFHVPNWKLLVLFFAISLTPLLALAACGGEEPPAAAPATVTPTTAPDPTAAATPATAQTSPPAATEAPTATAPARAPEPTRAPAATATPQPTAAPATPEPTAAPATPQPTEAPATPQPAVAPATAEPTEAPAEPATPVAPCVGDLGGLVGNCAPEFSDTQEWINSEPLSMESLRGKVVLIDFWTYSCINCIRTLPFLQTWHERYADEGLVIVGVHTPEFEFEKIYDNVVDATIEMGVAWPVVQDNNFSVWRSYSNRFWPAKYLIDANGEIRYRHFGEGKYAETEQEIRKLLEEAGMASEALAMPLPADQQAADPTYLTGAQRRRTPELFAGWKIVVRPISATRRVRAAGYLPPGQAQTSYQAGDQKGVVKLDI